MAFVSFYIIVKVYMYILFYSNRSDCSWIAVCFVFLAHLPWNGRVSFCDHLNVRRASCVVRRPSCVVRRRQQFVYTLGTTFLAQSSSNLVRMFVLMMAWPLLKMGVAGSKSRSLGQILEKSCLHSRDHIFGPILLKVAQIVNLDDVMSPLEMGVVGSKVGH